MRDGRVLITGAGGFVGSHLAAGFRALGHPVTALDRTFDADTAARLAGVDLVEADLALRDHVLRDLPAAEVVIHAAALTTGPDALEITAAEHVSANTLPLLAVLRHAGRIRPRAVVFLSSSGVFAEGDGSPDLADTDPPRAEGPYSAAKRAGEQLVPGALGGTCQTHVLRLGHLYGPAEAARPTRARVSMLQAWIEAARAGEALVVAANAPRRDWTFVPDLAPAVARLLTGPGRGAPVHLCAPGSVSDATLARMIVDRFPGARIETGPSVRAKAPMRPSALDALDGFAWTDLPKGLDATCSAGPTA